MRVVVTGAAGFLGQRLIKALLALGELTDGRGQKHQIEHIAAFDVVLIPDTGDTRVEAITGDLANSRDLERLIDADTASIFHLAAIVSGQAEQDLELGMKVNFDATRAVFDRVRTLGTAAKVVMTSSVAVFGGELSATVDDTQVWAPQSSYGTQKAMADLLLSDYSRRNAIDGRSLRMPTIVVRPGKPNRAASSFASGIIREPLQGVPAVCPIMPETILWLMSPGRAIENLIHGHELPSQALSRGRVINMPGLSISVDAIIRSLRRVAGDAVADLISFERDPAVERIVSSWPGNFSARYARSLDFKSDKDFDSVILQFMAENITTPN
jgi:nucleoside-diphosphate-sugar epimerase